MGTLKDLQYKAFITAEKLSQEKKSREDNETARETANTILAFIKQCHAYVTAFERLKELVIDEEESHFYNSWQFPVYEVAEGQEAELESLIPLFVSSITYKVIYQDAGGDLLDFYNTGEELQECSFFTVEGKILVYNVSVVIKQAFGRPLLRVINPQAKVEININPFHLVS